MNAPYSLSHTNEDGTYSVALLRDEVPVGVAVTVSTAAVGAAGYLLEMADDPATLMHEWGMVAGVVELDRDGLADRLLDIVGKAVPLRIPPTAGG